MSEEDVFRIATRDLANKIIDVVEAESERLLSSGIRAHAVGEIAMNAAMLAFAQLTAGGGADEAQTISSFRRCFQDMVTALKSSEH
jgi:hypothetical protein